MKRKLALLLVMVTSWATAGIYYKAETKTVGQKKAQNSEMMVEAWIEGPKAKIVFTESDNPMAGSGSYIVTSDGGKTMFLVNPEDKTYMEWDMDQMLQMAGAIMEGMQGIVSFTFENVKTEQLAKGNGDRMFGYDTEHYKFKTSYDMEIKILGMRRPHTVETVQDMWVTNAVKDMGLGIWLRTEPPATGNEDLDSLIREQMKMVKGFALRNKSVNTTKQWNKKRTKVKRETVTTTTTEVKEMRKAKFENGMDKVPSDYSRVETPMGGGENNPFKGIFGKKKN